MGIGTDELARLRDELIRARARGIRTLEYDGKRITYTSDPEMAAAIAFCHKWQRDHDFL